MGGSEAEVKALPISHMLTRRTFFRRSGRCTMFLLKARLPGTEERRPPPGFFHAPTAAGRASRRRVVIAPFV